MSYPEVIGKINFYLKSSWHKTLLLLTILSFMAGSCIKSDFPLLSACDIDQPLENIIWLKEMKNSLQNCDFETSIIKADFNGQIVFYSSITDPLFLGVELPTLYDCNGNVAKSYNSNSLNNFYEEVDAQDTIYTCQKTQ